MTGPANDQARVATHDEASVKRAAFAASPWFGNFHQMGMRRGGKIPNGATTRSAAIKKLMDEEMASLRKCPPRF